MSQRTNFIWELIITSAAITGIFLIGPAGWIILSLYVVLGIMNVVAYKRGTLEKMNEEATKRFRLVGNIALAAFVCCFIGAYLFEELKIAGMLLRDYKFQFSITAFLLAHGLAGVLFFRKG